MILLILSVVGLVVLVTVVVGFGRLAWRLFRGNEEMVAGGSMGDQMFGSKANRRPPMKKRADPR